MLLEKNQWNRINRRLWHEKKKKHFKKAGCMRWFGKKKKQAVYQELWSAEYIQSERLDPGIVDAQLPVDPRAFDAGEDAQVGGEPRRVWEKQGEQQSGEVTEDEGERAHEGERRKGWRTVPGRKNPWSKKIMSAACEPILKRPRVMLGVNARVAWRVWSTGGSTQWPGCNQMCPKCVQP